MLKISGCVVTVCWWWLAVELLTRDCPVQAFYSACHETAAENVLIVCDVRVH